VRTTIDKLIFPNARWNYFEIRGMHCMHVLIIALFVIFLSDFEWWKDKRLNMIDGFTRGCAFIATFYL
jgi:hypothetical protein